MELTVESTDVNELLEDLAEVLIERKFVKIIESRIEHCDITKNQKSTFEVEMTELICRHRFLEHQMKGLG